MAKFVLRADCPRSVVIFFTQPELNCILLSQWKLIDHFTDLFLMYPLLGRTKSHLVKQNSCFAVSIKQVLAHISFGTSFVRSCAPSPNTTPPSTRTQHHHTSPQQPIEIQMSTHARASSQALAYVKTVFVDFHSQSGKTNAVNLQTPHLKAQL